MSSSRTRWRSWTERTWPAPPTVPSAPRGQVLGTALRRELHQVGVAVDRTGRGRPFRPWAIVADLRALIRLGEGKGVEPTAAFFDSQTLTGTPESGARAGYDGHKKRKGSKIHLAVDTLGEFLALVVTPANEGDRAQVEELAAADQDATGDSIELAYVDPRYTRTHVFPELPGIVTACRPPLAQIGRMRRERTRSLSHWCAS